MAALPDFTGDILAWFDGLGSEPPGSFLLKRYGMSEAVAVARSKGDNHEAGVSLKGWFLDRLTVDPGVPGPFGDLAYNIISGALEHVDWDAVASKVRASTLN